jgi:hypothetical protein
MSVALWFAGRIQHGEDGAVAVHLAVADHRVVDGRRGAPGHEQQRQLLHLVERVKARSCRASEPMKSVVVEPDETVTRRQPASHGLRRRHGHADEELVDRRARRREPVARVVHDAVST